MRGITGRHERLIGKVVVGEYPAANYRGVRLRYEQRAVFVQRVGIEDQAEQEKQQRREPTLRRLGVLVTGRDLEKGETRSFYLGAFRRKQVVPLDRVKLFGNLFVDIADDDGVRRRSMPDIRESFAVGYEKEFPGEKVYPVSLAISVAKPKRRER